MLAPPLLPFTDLIIPPQRVHEGQCAGGWCGGSVIRNMSPWPLRPLLKELSSARAEQG